MGSISKGPARSLDKERFWRKQVLDQARSGLTAWAFCRAQGLSERSFYGWRRELARRDRQAQTDSPAAAALSPPRSPMSFAEVVLTGAAAAASALTIHLNAARIEVFSGCARGDARGGIIVPGLRQFQRNPIEDST